MDKGRRTMKSIIFNTGMMKAWLAGQKTVTRRPIKKQPDTTNWKPEFLNTPKEWRKQVCLGPGHYADPDMWCLFNVGDRGGAVPYTGIKQPYWPGETIYIRETWGKLWSAALYPRTGDGSTIVYKVDYNPFVPGVHKVDWKPSIHLPEKYAREFALIKSVRPERIREISEPDVMFEAPAAFWTHPDGPLQAFIDLWESIYPGTWERNDWCWRIELEKRPGP